MDRGTPKRSLQALQPIPPKGGGAAELGRSAWQAIRGPDEVRRMPAINEPEPGTDPFGPPVVSTLVGCLHCGQEYDSYRVEWRVGRDAAGQPWGFWNCPIPGCDGMGFGCDILPVDPDYQDEHGGWVHDAEDDDAGEGSEGNPLLR